MLINDKIKQVQKTPSAFLLAFLGAFFVGKRVTLSVTDFRRLVTSVIVFDLSNIFISLIILIPKNNDYFIKYLSFSCMEMK